MKTNTVEWELRMLVAAGLAAPALENAVERLEEDPELRKVFLGIAIAVLGAIGTELTARGLWEIEHLPLPEDTAEEIHDKVMGVLEAMDDYLNASPGFRAELDGLGHLFEKYGREGRQQ
jgi:hypothetical protein